MATLLTINYFTGSKINFTGSRNNHESGGQCYISTTSKINFTTSKNN